MPKTLRKLVPIGSNMNDAAYPFRGEHRVAAALNHGHSSSSVITTKTKPTTLAVRITGSNLVIEQLDTAKGQELKCELGIDGGIPRPVSLPVGDAQRLTPLHLAVPGDGRDYNMTATVLSSDGGKQYCKLTFNGTEGHRYLRVRAPPRVPRQPQVSLMADGERLEPYDGWFAVPLHTSECSITVSDDSSSTIPPPPPLRLTSGAGPSMHRVGQEERVGGIQWESSEVTALPHTSTPTVTQMTVETVHDLPANSEGPVLESVTTGQSIALADNVSVVIPIQEGPYRLRLPSVSSTHSSGGPPPPPVSLATPASVPPPPAPAGPPPPTGASTPPPPPLSLPGLAGAPLVPPTPVALSSTAVSVPTPVGDASVVVPPTPLTAPAPVPTPVSHPVPDVETSLSTSGTVPSFVVRAAGFRVHLTGDNMSTSSGMGEASLPVLRKAGTQFVRISILTESGVEVLRQRAQVPVLEAEPVEVRVTESNEGVSVAARKGSNILVNGTPAGPSMSEVGVQVAGGSVTQHVTVQQPNTDGSVSSVVLNVTPRANTSPPPPPPQPPSASQPDFAGWLSRLVESIRDAVATEGQRKLQSLLPPSPDAAVVQQFTHDQLVQTPPEFALVTQPNSIDGVQCPGFNLTAAVGNQPPQYLAANASLPVTPGTSVLLNAIYPSSGKAAGSCRVHLSVPPQKEDEVLMARILDSLQRHNMNPAAVAEDLSVTNNVSLSPLGHRTLPLLIQCLRKVLEGQQREHVLFTTRNGYIENIYTRDQQLLLTVSVNDGTPTGLAQHGRVPPSGTFAVNEPTFVKVVAKTIAGDVKGETVMTVMGPPPELPPPLQVSNIAQEPPPLPKKSPIHPPPTPREEPVAEERRPEPAPTVVLPNTSVLAHHAGAAVTPTLTPRTVSAAIPYLDISMQQVSQDIQIRALTAPGMLIACNVDGVGGNTGRNDFISKVHAHQPHTLELSVIDAYGQIAFQQKLEVPAVSSLVWGVCLQDNGLSVDPDGLSTTTTISLDRSPERSLQSNFMPFDTCKPHYVCLRRYLNGLHGICSGELALRLPGFISPTELTNLLHLLQSRKDQRLDEFNFERQMLMLSAQCGTPLMRDLLALLLEVLKKGMESGGGHDAGGPRVFFRLTGAE